MKVIVTGASGFIGRNVLLRAPRTWEITALYNRSLDFDLFVHRSGLTHVTPVSCDLTDAVSVAALAKRIDLRADAVLYLAANADPSRSVEHPAWDLQSN